MSLSSFSLFLTSNRRYPRSQVWQVSENKLVFTNSYKMKMSVILGVAQMFFGVILSTFNHVYISLPTTIGPILYVPFPCSHAKSYISLAVEFVPQVLFLLCIFGWLVFLMVAKWVTFYANSSTVRSLVYSVCCMTVYV